MNREIRDEWVARLRSGQYIQGKSWLRTLENRHCCLGILCEMAAEQDIVTRELIPSEITRPPRYRYVSKEGTYSESDTQSIFPHVSSDNCLPLGVVNWAGLDDTTPVVKDGYNIWSLTQMNDTGKSFYDIADVIEKGRI